MTPYEAAAVFRIWEQADIGSEGLMWKVGEDPERGMRMLAVCSDVFHWATADAEEITESDVPLLESCRADLPEFEIGYLPELFAARKRRMRPMRAFYRDVDDEAVVALFDACGPVRTRGGEG